MHLSCTVIVKHFGGLLLFCRTHVCINGEPTDDGTKCGEFIQALNEKFYKVVS